MKKIPLKLKNAETPHEQLSISKERKIELHELGAKLLAGRGNITEDLANIYNNLELANEIIWTVFCYGANFGTCCTERRIAETVNALKKL